MRSAVIHREFDSWREQARLLLDNDVAPNEVLWTTSESSSLFPSVEIDRCAAPVVKRATHRVPTEFVAMCRLVACNRDGARWELMYRALWRISHGEAHLLQLAADDDVHRLRQMEKSVSRDRHKMTAFVRFRCVVQTDGSEHFVAWHRPEHFIVKLTAPFFAERFAAMRWTILTPDDSVSWDGNELCFGEGVPASAAPRADDLEDLWNTYYANIFNPARIKLNAMRKEMPRKHWATMPETELIPQMLRDAPKRVDEMVKRTARTREKSSNGTFVDCANTGDARDFFPKTISLTQMREAVQKCRGCDLYCNASQAVFGEGAAYATAMFVGEQPGDQEDLAGRPFVGPSGQLLDNFLEEAGIDRKHDVYVTNAVKHFKFEQRGKRRMHSTPNAREMAACRPWLEEEVRIVKPKLLVCLGATAAKSLLGAGFRITKQRGELITDTDWAPVVMATYHPSALLRAPDEEIRKRMHAEYRDDLAIVAKQIKKLKAAG